MFAGSTWPLQFSDSVGFEYENVASMRPRKIVAHLVDKNLVPKIRVGAHDRLSLLVLLPEHWTSLVERGQHTKLFQLVRRDPDRITLSRSHLDQRSIPQPPQFDGADLRDAIVVLRGNHIRVGPPDSDKLESLYQEIRSRPIDGLGNDTAQRGLHRAGRNFERLQIVCS